ncbi:MAG: enoyl-CoA hydratase-related protein [Dehalococcoidales bacterium]|nr:enoyl-CoA hydratase-related protein [Dehalococcoidales bacterium]
MAYQFILYEKADGSAVITLNRPDKLNAWSEQMKSEMMDAMADAAGDDNVAAVIFTGAGRGFSSGRTNQPWEETQRTADAAPRSSPGTAPGGNRWIEKLIDFDKPTIAAINGVMAGAAISFACACDVRMASDRAQLRMSWSRIGLVPGSASVYWLTQIIGKAHLFELVYTNDVIDAKEMERIGLVNRVVPHDELIPYCREMVKKMRVIPPITLKTSKKIIQRVPDMKRDLEEARMWEAWGWRVVEDTSDRAEAHKSFLEKRQPVYKGR